MQKKIRAILLLLLFCHMSFLGTVSDERPFFDLCGRAEAGWWSTTTELSFDDLYSSISSRGVTLSDKLRSNEGCTVSMVGFMAPPLTPTINFFVLTREPMSICPFCGSDADWPTDIVVVKLDNPVTALPFDSPIRVTGTLELGSEVDAETGFVSLVRIKASSLEAM